MRPHQRMKDKDEELGRRNDVFKPRMNAGLLAIPSQLGRWRKRPIIAGLAAILLLYLLVTQILASRNATMDNPGNLLHPGRPRYSSSDTIGLTEAPPRESPAEGDERSLHYYNGKIRYYKLASSLHGITKTQGMRTANRNVLFAASSLRSVANLMPLACAMGKWDRNFVHFAILGRDPMSIAEILQINGVSDEACHLFMHDGRSDYSEYSSDERAGVAVEGAMKHINDFMHPQAIITDDERIEDQFFTEAMRSAAKSLKCALIQIPKGRYEDFFWMTKMDSGSLASWHLPTIDILIHAPQQSSGGLLRTIKSLQDADYTGLKPPRLTIELPPDVDEVALKYLQELQWPPDKRASPLRTNTLALRHRIPSARLTTEEASLRFFEAFYPTHPDDNHVLVLSAQAEVDPLYFQFLYYSILEYKYSSYGAADLNDLLGISLDVPDLLVDGKSEFKVPEVAQMNSKIYTEDKAVDQRLPVPFLYGAPTSTAALFFGDKWALLHNFLKFRLAAVHSGKAEKSDRLVAEAEPIWTEYFLELMRAKGWFMLHSGTPFVTVHNELARIPEEFMRLKKESSRSGTSDEDEEEDEEEGEDEDEATNETFLSAPQTPQILSRIEKDLGSAQPLHELLPFDGDLPELPHLPYVDHLGIISSNEAPKVSRMLYSGHFRRHFGGCSPSDADRPRVVPFSTTEDLFCLPDMDIQYSDVEKEIERPPA